MTSRRAGGIVARWLLAMGWAAIGCAPCLSAEAISYQRVSRLRHEQREVESSLAKLLAERSRVTGATATALEAKINLRVIVHLLYSQALVQSDQSLRCLMATRADVLHMGLGDLDRLVDQVGAWQADLAKLPGGSKDAAIVRQARSLQARLDGIALLGKIAGKDLPAELPGAEELEELTAPVARAILLMASPERVGPEGLDLPPSWPERDEVGPVGDEANAAAVDLAALSEAIQRSGTSAALRRQMLDSLDLVQRRASDPKERAQALKAARLLKDHLQVAQTIAQTKAVGERTKGRLEQQILTGLLLSADPRTRTLGHGRLALVGRAAALLDRLGKAPLKAEARGQLAKALRQATSFLDDPLYEERGERMLEALDRVSDLTLRFYRDYDDVRVDKPFDDPFETARTGYAASIEAALTALAQEDLAGVEAQTRSMTQRLRDLALIASLPEALTGLRAVLPTQTIRLRQRLADAAGDLVGGGTQRAAAERLLRSASSAEALIERFRALAYDRRRFAVMDKALGGRMTVLRRSGEAFAKDVVSSLAAEPRTPRAPARSNARTRRPEPTKEPDPRKLLEQRVVLLSAAYDVAQLDRLEWEVGQLGRWRAWALVPESAGKLLQQLSASVAAAADQAKDKNADLASVLPRVEQYTTVARMLVEVGEHYGGWLVNAPEGAVGIAARLREAPDRPMTPSEVAAMQMCFEINEAGYAEQVGLSEYAVRHLAEARKLLDAALGRKR